MTTPIPALLAAIAAADLASVPILADALEEAGRARAARLLRARHRKWERDRAACEEHVDVMERALTAQWDELAATVRRLGGEVTVQVQASRESVERQDRLLIAYVARLARAEGL